MHNVIAIDGPAASGKGTLARRIAAALGYAYLDTGLLYRAVAHDVIRSGAEPANEAAAVASAAMLREQIGQSQAVLDNPALREEEVSEAASHIAAIAGVREQLLDLQRDFAKSPPNGAKGAVLDGRDIGTVICPDAHVKLFITAETDVRAQRRYKELQLKGKDVTYGAVLEDMRARDARDQGRGAAPMRMAEDAFILDTSALDAEQAFEKAMAYVAEKQSL